MSNDDNRDDAGRWKQGGPSPNPGGMTRTQARIMRALENMSDGAAQRLWELMHSSDEKIAIAAVSEYYKRMAPPPPRQAKDVNITVNAASTHLAALKARVANRPPVQADPVVIDVEPVAPAASALPAPKGNEA